MEHVVRAGAYSSFGTTNNNAGLGTPNGSDNAYYVNSNGNVNNNNNTSNSYVCAPCFSKSAALRDCSLRKGLRFSVPDSGPDVSPVTEGCRPILHRDKKPAVRGSRSRVIRFCDGKITL